MRKINVIFALYINCPLPKEKFRYVSHYFYLAYYQMHNVHKKTLKDLICYHLFHMRPKMNLIVL